jgi:hypothetical protein
MSLIYSFICFYTEILKCRKLIFLKHVYSEMFPSVSQEFPVEIFEPIFAHLYVILNLSMLGARDTLQQPAILFCVNV